MVNKYYITEWLSSSKVEDVKIWIYQLTLKDVENRHTDISKVKYALQRKNKNQSIVYNDTYIASFHPIKQWDNHSYISEENRVITINHPIEKRLFERLIKQHLLDSVPKKYIK